MGTHTNSSAMSQARHQNPNFRSKKLIFREPDRPFETAPKTTRESTSTKSRCALIPSRVTRLKRQIKLSTSRRLMCLPLRKKIRKHRDPVQLQRKWCGGCTSVVHVARCFFAFPIKAHVFSLLFRQTVQGEQCLLCDGCNEANSSTQKHILAQGFARKFVCNRGASPATRTKLVEQSAVHSIPSAKRQSGSCSVGHGRGMPILLTGKRGRTLSSSSKTRCKIVRFTPTAAITIVVSMSESGHSTGNPSVPEMPSTRFTRNSPESVLPFPHLFAFEVVKGTNSLNFACR